jgi:hypothetical protein
LWAICGSAVHDDLSSRIVVVGPGDMQAITCGAREF